MPLKLVESLTGQFAELVKQYNDQQILRANRSLTIDEVCGMLTGSQQTEATQRLAQLRETVCPACELSLFCLRGTCEGVWCRICLSYHVPSLNLNVDCDIFPVAWFMRAACVSRANTVRCPSCKEGEPPARRVIGARLWPLPTGPRTGDVE